MIPDTQRAIINQIRSNEHVELDDLNYHYE